MCMSFQIYRRDVNPFDTDSKGRLIVVDVSINWPSNRNLETKVLDSWKATRLTLLLRKCVFKQSLSSRTITVNRWSVVRQRWLNRQTNKQKETKLKPKTKTKTETKRKQSHLQNCCFFQLIFLNSHSALGMKTSCGSQRLLSSFHVSMPRHEAKPVFATFKSTVLF